MPRYRKKPVVIEAFRFEPVRRPIGACAKDAPIWFLQAEDDGKAKIWGDDEVPYCMLQTLSGPVRAEAGDWIIKGTKEGDIYPCKPDIFEATYEPE
jgi:hypothetical protein